MFALAGQDCYAFNALGRCNSNLVGSVAYAPAICTCHPRTSPTRAVSQTHWDASLSSPAEITASGVPLPKRDREAGAGAHAAACRGALCVYRLKAEGHPKSAANASLVGVRCGGANKLGKCEGAADTETWQIPTLEVELDVPVQGTTTAAPATTTGTVAAPAGNVSNITTSTTAPTTTTTRTTYSFVVAGHLRPPTTGTFAFRVETANVPGAAVELVVETLAVESAGGLEAERVDVTCTVRGAQSVCDSKQSPLLRSSNLYRFALTLHGVAPRNASVALTDATKRKASLGLVAPPDAVPLKLHPLPMSYVASASQVRTFLGYHLSRVQLPPPGAGTGNLDVVTLAGISAPPRGNEANAHGQGWVLYLINGEDDQHKSRLEFGSVDPDAGVGNIGTASTVGGHRMAEARFEEMQFDELLAIGSDHEWMIIRHKDGTVFGAKETFQVASSELPRTLQIYTSAGGSTPITPPGANEQNRDQGPFYSTRGDAKGLGDTFMWSDDDGKRDTAKGTVSGAKFKNYTWTWFGRSPYTRDSLFSYGLSASLRISTPPSQAQGPPGAPPTAAALPPANASAAGPGGSTRSIVCGAPPTQVSCEDLLNDTRTQGKPSCRLPMCTLAALAGPDSSPPDPPAAEPGATMHYYAAEDGCQRVGGRLCTAGELARTNVEHVGACNDGAGAGGGGGLVWTSDTCSGGRVALAPYDGASVLYSTGMGNASTAPSDDFTPDKAEFNAAFEGRDSRAVLRECDGCPGPTSTYVVFKPVCRSAEAEAAPDPDACVPTKFDYYRVVVGGAGLDAEVCSVYTSLGGMLRRGPSASLGSLGNLGNTTGRQQGAARFRLVSFNSACLSKAVVNQAGRACCSDRATALTPAATNTEKAATAKADTVADDGDGFPVLVVVAVVAVVLLAIVVGVLVKRRCCCKLATSAGKRPRKRSATTAKKRKPKSARKAKKEKKGSGAGSQRAGREVAPGHPAGMTHVNPVFRESIKKKKKKDAAQPVSGYEEVELRDGTTGPPPLEFEDENTGGQGYTVGRPSTAGGGSRVLVLRDDHLGPDWQAGDAAPDEGYSHLNSNGQAPGRGGGGGANDSPSQAYMHLNRGDQASDSGQAYMHLNADTMDGRGGGGGGANDHPSQAYMHLNRGDQASDSGQAYMHLNADTMDQRGFGDAPHSGYNTLAPVGADCDGFRTHADDREDGQAYEAVDLQRQQEEGDGAYDSRPVDVGAPDGGAFYGDPEGRGGAFYGDPEGRNAQDQAAVVGVMGGRSSVASLAAMYGGDEAC